MMIQTWKKTILATCLISVGILEHSFAQCLQGDCQNGWGQHKDDKGRIYEGYFKDGKRNGKGTYQYSNGDTYDGNWVNGLPDGSGIRYFADGTAQAGEWKEGKLIKQSDMTVQAALKCLEGDCANGYGKSEDQHGRKYTGYFKNNLYEGFGEMLYPEEGRYKGNWKRGLPEGKGVRYYRDGHYDAGDWTAGKFQNPFRMWVLVVGVADYPNFPKLTFTVNDAQKVYDFYRSPEGGNVPADRATLLLNDKATRKNIQKELAKIADMADTSDLIVFYFAGHGEEKAFLPYDYNGTTKENRLEHTVVNTLMADSKAKFKLCVADACHSGSFYMSFKEYEENDHQMPAMTTRSSQSFHDKMRMIYQAFEKSKGGLGVIMSSASEEISLEASKLQQGVFSYCFIQGLRGHADTDKDNIVDISELYQFIYDNVRKFTYRFQNPMINEPEVNGKFYYDPKMPIGFKFSDEEMKEKR